MTVITTSQTIGPINFNFGSTTLLTPFTAFSDSQGTCYANTALCPLTYSVSANTYGVTVVAGPKISVYTTNSALKGTSTTITLTANSTPQQTSAAPTLMFTVNIVDTCPTTVISLGT